MDTDQHVKALRAMSIRLENDAKREKDPGQRGHLNMAAGYVQMAVDELNGRMEFQEEDLEEDQLPAKGANKQMDGFDDDFFDEDAEGDDELFDEQDAEDYEFAGIGDDFDDEEEDDGDIFDEDDDEDGDIFDEGDDDDELSEFDEDDGDIFDEGDDEDDEDGDIATAV